MIKVCSNSVNILLSYGFFFFLLFVLILLGDNFLTGVKQQICSDLYLNKWDMHEK